MAITNLHKAKHPSGAPVLVEELRIGVVVNFPSGMGGSFTCKCVSLDEGAAVFNSTMRDWPVSFICELNAIDLTPTEISQLNTAMRDCGIYTGKGEQRELIRRAIALGYLDSASSTQIHWSQKGVDAFKAVKNAGEAS